MSSMTFAKLVQHKRVRIALVSFSLVGGFLWLLGGSFDPGPLEASWSSSTQASNPIGDVIRTAQNLHARAVAEETNNVEDGAIAYRRRRGRHPPPGFDKWYESALQSDAVIVESFFDQIYEDLEPFWGIDPLDIRGALADWKTTIRIRNGKIEDSPREDFRSFVWVEMLGEVSSVLPDMDIPVNPLDEPRLFVPWHEIDALTTKASRQREHMMSLALEEFSNTSGESISETLSSTESHRWITQGDMWPYILSTCNPWRHNFGHNHNAAPTANWTDYKDICANPEWARAHGSIINPASMSLSTKLVPIFSATKLQGNNDILLPPASYFADGATYSGVDELGDPGNAIPWSNKTTGLVWRGKATGGIIQESKWESFHRQRLVSMLNSSDASLWYNDTSYLWPADVKSGQQEHRNQGALSEWLEDIANAGLTDLICAPEEQPCQAMASRYKVAAPVPMRQQYRWKYLPDIDGNSLSGRFRAFLKSNSSPMKATVFKEWHDSRLMPWVHFIPLDITLKDLWHTAAYFMGFPGVDPHDQEGEGIASEGRDWADKVLRKEDMLLYVHRLLLEYSRITNDGRDRLGYVDDIR